MSYKIEYNHKGSISGRFELPASKSISNRVLIINALSGSDKSVANLAKCDDTDVMVKALTSDSHLVDIGAAGTSMRFLTAYLSIQPGEWTIWISANEGASDTDPCRCVAFNRCRN